MGLLWVKPVPSLSLFPLLGDEVASFLLRSRIRTWGWGPLNELDELDKVVSRQSPACHLPFTQGGRRAGEGGRCPSSVRGRREAEKERACGPLAAISCSSKHLFFLGVNGSQSTERGDLESSQRPCAGVELWVYGFFGFYIKKIKIKIPKAMPERTRLSEPTCFSAPLQSLKPSSETSCRPPQQASWARHDPRPRCRPGLPGSPHSEGVLSEGRGGLGGVPVRWTVQPRAALPSPSSPLAQGWS